MKLLFQCQDVHGQTLSVEQHDTAEDRVVVAIESIDAESRTYQITPDAAQRLAIVLSNWSYTFTPAPPINVKIPLVCILCGKKDGHIETARASVPFLATVCSDCWISRPISLEDAARLRNVPGKHTHLGIVREELAADDVRRFGRDPRD